MTDEKDLIKTLVPEKVAEKGYDDLLSGIAKEVGGFGTDIAKTARLILAPVQLAAAYQDRFRQMVERIASKVPEDRRIEPAAEVVGPALEKMKFLDDKSPLWHMFETLLEKSIDEEVTNSIHPSFSVIISQLSRDEALILYLLSQSDFEVTDCLDLNRKENRFENRRIEQSNLPTSALFLPDKLDLYYSHLESLSLVSWPVYQEELVYDDSGKQTGLRRFSRMHLTDFGKLFCQACVPESGFKANGS